MTTDAWAATLLRVHFIGISSSMCCAAPDGLSNSSLLLVSLSKPRFRAKGNSKPGYGGSCRNSTDWMNIPGIRRFATTRKARISVSVSPARHSMSLAFTRESRPCARPIWNQQTWDSHCIQYIYECRIRARWKVGGQSATFPTKWLSHDQSTLRPDCRLDRVLSREVEQWCSQADSLWSILELKSCGQMCRALPVDRVSWFAGKWP